VFHQLNNIENSKIFNIFKIQLILTIFGGLYCVFLVYSIPSEIESILLFGLSKQRLILITIMLLAVIYLSYSFFNSNILVRKLMNVLEKRTARVILFLFSIFIFWISFVRNHDFGNFSFYYARLNPFLLFLGLVCINLLVFNLLRKVFYEGKEIESIQKFNFFSLNFHVFFIPIIVIVLILGKTKLGIAPRTDYWGEAGSILLGYQLILSILFSISVVLIYKFVVSKFKGKSNIEILIFLFLWISAIILIINKELPHNYFYPVTSFPGSNRFPFSDSSGYDIFANSILIGKGFLNTAFTNRPVYIVFLAILHFLSGSNYSNLINFQVLILSLSIPLLFLIGKQLHSRILGLTLATIYLFLELNSIGSAAFVQVSNSKLLLTEPLTGLFIIFITFLLIKGFRKIENKKYIYFSAGILGLAFLTRGHSALLIIPILFMFIIYSIQNNEKWFKNVSNYLIITMIVILPWMIRNYIVVGKFSPDPNRFTLLLNNRWDLDNNPEDKNNSKNQKLRLPIYEQSDFRNDESAISNMAEHFFHNEALSFLALPLSYNFQTIDNYYQNSFNFWKDWAGTLEFSEKILLFFNLLIFSIGISRSWVKYKFYGLIPMFFQISYHAGNALVRTSGWRYLKPVDWVVFLYFAIGIVEIINYLSKKFIDINLDFKVESSNNEIYISKEVEKPKDKIFFLNATLFFLVGVFISFGPLLISDRYEDQDEFYVHDSVSELLPQVLGYNKGDHYEDFLLSENTFYEVGKLLYPRYFDSGGLAYRQGIQFYGLEFPRYEFVLLNDHRNNVYLPLDNYELIENGGDIIVFGCKEQGEINALGLILLDEKNRIILRSPLLNFECPLVNPN
jgi:hypothetical protein